MKQINPKDATPKMSRQQAKIFWNSLTPEQKIEFNKLMKRLDNKELVMTNVLVDDNEQVQRVILNEKNQPSQSDKPFYDKFNIKD